MDGGTEPSSNVTIQTGSGGSNKKKANGSLKESNNLKNSITKNVNDLDAGDVENSSQATSSNSLASSASSPLLGTAITTEYNRRRSNTNIQQHQRPINVERCNPIETLVKRHKSNNPCNNNNNSNNRISNANYLLGNPVPLPPGCGCIIRESSPEPDEINISITPTIGGQFDLTVDRNETITNLKKIISNRLKLAKERICLLHRERWVFTFFFYSPLSLKLSLSEIFNLFFQTTKTTIFFKRFFEPPILSLRKWNPPCRGEWNIFYT